VYPRPFEFVPGRFLRASSSQAEEKLAGGVQTAAAETAQNFATWGIGKHACPGHFFAVDIIKIILMHVLLVYELKALPKRPENVWIEYNVIPPPVATLSVRRSKPGV
jgi:cytochrome P450